MSIERAEAAQPRRLAARRRYVRAESMKMKVWAYVFISTHEPKNVVRVVRRVEGVIHADALLGSPDVLAIVEGEDIARMDAVIDRLAEIDGVAGTDSKVARWIDGVGPPRRAAD